MVSDTDGSAGIVQSSRPWRYGIAVLCVVVAAAVQLALDSLIAPGQFLLAFALAVVAAARIGGLGPGLAASFLSLVLTWYLFIEPRFSFSIADPRSAGSLLALAAAGTAISVLLARPTLSASPAPEGRSDTSFFRRVLLFGSAFLVLAILTRLLYSDFDRERDRQRWVTHSYQVLDAIHVLMSNLQDAETGQRGYLLTGDASYREPFQSAVRGERSARESLRQLTAGEPFQQSNMETVDRLVEAQFSELEKTIHLRQTEGVEAALAVVRTGAGKRIMDECRAALSAMQQEDLRLLAARTLALEEEAARTRWVLGLGSGALLLLLVVAGMVIERESRNRERARRSASLGEERLRLALDAAAAGIWEWDPQSGQSVWSPEVWNVYGVPPHSVQPSYEAWRELVHPDDRASAEAAVQEAVRSGTELNMQHRVVDGHGNQRWVLCQGRMLRNVEGRAVRFFGIVLDITARKKDEEALRESDAQFRTLANAIPQLCWIANADGWTSWYNQRWYEYTGTTPERMKGWGWQQVHDPAALPAVLDRWKSSIATGDPFDMVFPLRRADGVMRPFLTRIMPVHDRDGRVAGWFGTNTDITEQRQVEQALRESEELLKTFVRYVPAAVAMLDSDMRYVQVSDRWCADYALRSEDIVGRLHYEIFPDIPDHWKEIHRRCLAGETLRRDEDRWERAHGETTWLHWEIRPWGERNGKPEGVLIFTEDITARKRIEATLRESEATIRTLLETAAQAIVAVDTGGAVVLANRMAEEMFGYGPGELLAIPLESLVPERFRTRHVSHRAGFANNSRTRPMGIGLDLHGLRKDGAEFPIEVSLSTVGTSRGPLSVAFVSDITLRKQAETSLRNSERELRALARSLLTAQEDERRRVARDLHDDVTQRLALLSINIGKLAAGIPSSVEEIKTQLQDCQSEALEAANEVRRVSHGLHPSVIQDFGLSPALEEFCAEFAKAQGIMVTFDGPDDDAGLSPDGASCLYRVAQECLHNAAKHACATEIRVALAATGATMQLVVADNGAGFSAEGHRINRGLGLMSMKERIRMANGTFSISSEPGQGTEVVASLPLSGDGV